MAYHSVQDIVADLEARPAESGGHIYHPIPFPEFDRLKTSTPALQAAAKRAVIEAALARRFPAGMAGRSFLDIGANGGYHTFHLAQQGARVTAYEGHPRYGPIGAFLAKERAPNVEWHDRFFGSADLEGRRYDAALMLSVFNWISHGDQALGPAYALLRQVSEHCDALVFELGLNNGSSAITTQQRNHARALDRMLRKHTVYDHRCYLGSTTPWGAKGRRHIFLCTKGPPVIRSARQWRTVWPPW